MEMFLHSSLHRSLLSVMPPIPSSNHLIFHSLEDRELEDREPVNTLGV